MNKHLLKQIVKKANDFVKLADNIDVKHFVSYFNNILNLNVSDDDVYGWFSQNGSWIHNSKFYIISGTLRQEFDDYYGVISKDKPDISGDDTLIREIVLQGYGSIPQLYYSIAEYGEYGASEKTESFIEKDKDQVVAHNYFIYQALNSLTYTKDIEDVSFFIKENISRINDLKKFFTENPKLLGRGAEGVAFSISKDKVIML